MYFRNVIQSYGDEIIYIQQPDQSDPVLPEKEKKFKGYFKIARHYGWALNHGNQLRAILTEGLLAPTG